MTAKNKRPSEPRRANKPLMEKRRRARINQSLAALKTLILDTAKADNTKHSKLEKADILELTVRHFQRHRSLDIKGINQYKSGYADCVREVQRYLETPDAQTMTVIDSGIRQRLLRHLDNCVSEVDVDLRQAAAATPASVVPVVTSSSAVIAQPAGAGVDERLKSHDSNTGVTPMQEVNNNMNPVNGELKTDDPKTIKNYDGNFVLLLPEHYVQLANALGVNLRQNGDNSNNSSTVPSGSSSSSSSSNASTSSGCRNGDNHQSTVNVKERERPLDFSKANERSDSMWRPW